MTNEELRKVQKRFVGHVAMLIIYAHDNGFELTFGEATRSKDQVLLNYYGFSVVENANGLELTIRSPTSKTKESKHLDRLAVDFNIFKDGRLLFTESQNRIPDLKLVQMMGNYWCNLHTNNRWGGDFNRNKNVLDETFSDPYHFETA